MFRWACGSAAASILDAPALRRKGIQLETEDFSISFPGTHFDETPYIRQVAARYGTDHEEFDLNPDEKLAGAIEEFAYYSDEPNADAGALPVWFLSRMRKTECDGEC